MDEFSVSSLERKGWTRIGRSHAYQTYIQLLQTVEAQLSDEHRLYDLEMTLFSQAVDLAMQAASKSKAH